MHHSGPFAIPAINNFVPEKWKPFIFIFFVIVIQFTGGVYLATASQMVGATSLMQEDILMAGYASLIGMALTFVIMLRLKMRFTSKFSLLFSIAVIIAGNLIALYTNNVVLLITTCFVVGIFKMWATFECNSTIQLWLTPTRDLSVFFCFIYLLVHGTILVSGIPNMYVAFFASWQYMHWLVIGALLLVALIIFLIFNNNRFMRPFPLFGIDWLGGLMWGLILLCLNFITVYGEHYDWWHAEGIQMASFFLIVLLALNLYRASFIRHPFIALQTFKYKALYITLFLYVVVDIFLAPAHLVESIYFEKILHYDAMHMVQINWMGLLGVIGGAVFTFFYFAKRKNSYKSTFMVGFAAVVMYLIMMYFLIDVNTGKSLLFAPIFFRNFGYVIIAIVLLTNLVKIPFNHFFQAVSVQAFISAACGGAIGSAFLHHLFNRVTAKNFQLASAGLDRVNTDLASIAPAQLNYLLETQVLMVSFKEVYGYLVIFSLACLAGFLFYRYPYLPSKTFYPKMRAIRRMLRKETMVPETHS